jgi:hypothetical protein
MSGKAQIEQITSGLPATADMARTCREVRVVPKGDIIFRAFAGCAARDSDEMIE